jgi:hypothetical protein
MQKLLKTLQANHPQLRFTSGTSFLWSPETNEVFYKLGGTGERDIWALLHETGHALLGHQSYTSDVQLLKMEIEAWQKARQLGGELTIAIDENHIQDCLDTYRDWLNARALCPSCATRCLQQNSGKAYRCHNCHTSWNVTPSRFTRPYRAVSGKAQSATVFAAKA